MSDEKAELDCAERQAGKEREAGLETSPKLEMSTHYVMNLGHTSYSAPKFLCIHFSATVPSFPILLKSTANLSMLGARMEWTGCCTLCCCFLYPNSPSTRAQTCKKDQK